MLERAQWIASWITPASKPAIGEDWCRFFVAIQVRNVAFLLFWMVFFHTLCPCRLHSIESKLLKIQADTTKKAAQESQSHLAQHERLKKQIATVNAERDAQVSVFKKYPLLVPNTMSFFYRNPSWSPLGVLTKLFKLHWAKKNNRLWN